MTSFIQSILSLLTFPKPVQTMDYDTWAAIITPDLNQPIDLILHHYITAASNSHNAEILMDRVKVDWITVYKNPVPPQHEYLIVGTNDSEEYNPERQFIFERVVGKLTHNPEHSVTASAKES